VPDPGVKKHIAEFAALRVLASDPGEGEAGPLKTEPLARDVTVRDVLRHTAGSYVDDYPMKGTSMDTGFSPERSRATPAVDSGRQER
jgi:CubicO group peptidase (beta-lactamase class C family)